MKEKETNIVTSCMRRCVGSGKSIDKKKMIRFVISPENQVVLDIKGKLPGKGMWVSNNKHILTNVVKKNIFSKVAKRSVFVSEDLVRMVEILLLDKALKLLSLARNAGKVRVDFDKVKKLVKSHKADIVLCFGDNNTDSYNKLLGMCRMLDIMVVNNIDEIKVLKILNKEVVLFAAIEKCGISKLMKEDMDRWIVFQNGEKKYD